MIEQKPTISRRYQSPLSIYRSIYQRVRSSIGGPMNRRFVVALAVALLSVTLLGLSTLPVYAAFQYRMVVTNSTGASLYLFAAPWDQVLPTQSSCLDLGTLGVQQTIGVGQSVTLVFNRSGRCDGEQGWLSLRASNNPQSTGTDYQQFWFDNDGGLEKHGLTSAYQNQLSGGAGGIYRLNILTGTDIGHDFARYGYKMAVTNASGRAMWVTAAPDDEGKYGHLRSSCITPNGTVFGYPYALQSGQTKNFYFRRSNACSGLQGWLSLRASAEQNSNGTDFQQFWFDNAGGLEKQGSTASWPNSLSTAGSGNYALNVAGAEVIGGYTFRNFGYQRPEYANWPGQNPIARQIGPWDGTRQVAELTWRTNGRPVGDYVTCSFAISDRYWHTQSMVQLPSKNGRAYFARTDSHRHLGSFYVMRTDADAYDPANDYVKNTAGTDGEVVFLDQYWGGSRIGDWNHPGDMSVVGNILVIAGQQWHSTEEYAGSGGWFWCGEYDEHGVPFDYDDKFEGQDADAALFYDVSDPEHPQYLGKITESELGFGGQDAISAVALSKTANGLWDLMIGGNSGTKHFRAAKPWPNLSVWQEYTNALSQYVTLNSYENGLERLLNVSTSSDNGQFTASTVQFLGPVPGFNLTADTTNATAIDGKTFAANLHSSCKEGGGSASVSQSGAVHIQCPYLGKRQKPGNNECTDTNQECIVSFHYSMPITNVAPTTPASPTPADGATNAPINSIFTWSGGDDPDVGDTVTYNVLLLLPNARNGLYLTVCSQITVKSCDASRYLQNGTAYTWQVVANDGWLSTKGPSWTFNTVPGNVAPNAPTNPAPTEKANDVSVTAAFSWTGSDPDAGDTLTYDLYLAKFGEPTYTLVCNDVTPPSCDPAGDFEYGSGYFWMVEANDGKTTTRSPDWTFHTIPGFTLSMEATPNTFREQNEVIEYTYTIQNTRNTTIAGPFSVVDSRLGTVAPCGSTPLAAGATTTCTAGYTTQASDVGDWISTSAYVQQGELTSASASTYISYDDPAKLALTVEAAPLIYSRAGDLITYTYTIINIGDVPLTGPFSVRHFHKDIGLIASCGDAASLAVGEQTSCTRVYTINSQDLDQYPLSTEASATAIGSDTGTLGFSRVRVDKEAKELGFRITMSPLSYSTAGQVITYTYTISNVGNVSLPGPFTVRIDGMTDPITPCGSGPLAPKEQTRCTTTYIVAQRDVNGGSLPPHLGRAQTDGASSAIFGVTVPGATGDLLLRTVATPTIYSLLGEEIVYQYTITNTSAITLNGPFIMVDDQLGTINCGNFKLGPGIGATCRGVHEISQADLSRGVITSNAMAQGNSATSESVRSTVNVGSRALSLSREVTPQGYSAVGTVVTYRYIIQNTSDVALAGPFTVIDDQMGTINACGEGPLAPGASTSCTAPHTITQADLDAGSITSNAFVYGDGATSPSVKLVLTAQGSTNQAPTVVNDQTTTLPGTAVTINVTANDSDADGDTLTVTILTQPTNGTATVSNGQIVYTPNAGFTGTDSFTYRVSDGKGGEGTGTVTVVTSADSLSQSVYLPIVSR